MPQQAWSKKRERQYEHIKEGLEDRGRERGHRRGDRRAHRQQGAGPRRRGRAGEQDLDRRHLLGPPRRPPLAPRRGGRTKAQLYNEARSKGIKGRSKMSKAELERALDR